MAVLENSPNVNFQAVLPARDGIPQRETQEEICPGGSPPAQRAGGGRLRLLAKAESRTLRLLGKSRRSPALEERAERVAAAIRNACEGLKLRKPVGSEFAGDARWLLENSGFLRSVAREVLGSVRRVRHFQQVQTRDSECVPRAYSAVISFLRTVQYHFDEGLYASFLDAFQDDLPFELSELWMLKSFTQLALLEQIAAAAEQIYTNGVQSTAAEPARLALLITSLRSVNDVVWKDRFEQLSVTDRILRDDPAEAYSRMVFQNRDAYRDVVADLAAHSKWSEPEIARRAVALASAARHASGIPARVRERRSHVGYYLVAEGRQILQRELDYAPRPLTRIRQAILRRPQAFYLSGIAAGTVALTAAVFLHSPVTALWGLAALLLFLFPASECAISIMNQLSTAVVPPRALPKLDFSEGLPDDCVTLAVVPALLIGEEQIRRAVKDLEIRYLANRDRNLHFALLTDAPDSAVPPCGRNPLAELCAKLIQELNQKYAAHRKGSFFLFHRKSPYNSSEDAWMGWERKRGKLLDLNRLLLNEGDAFSIKVGDLSILRTIRYVITLDLDTQLPREAAHRLAGTLAHPLNRAVIDPETNTVAEGYAILQPRVGISMESARSSRLAALFSGDTGFDLYTRAVSDVYQDLFGEGTYTGKGIYEVGSFQKVLGRRFPCNTLLSHDMIEGAYARAGLASDIEVVDDYPSHYSALTRRKHRWIRGDWQISRWMLARVPDSSGTLILNSLRLISRWKIFDNLRRSLTEFATLGFLLCAWTLSPAHAIYWTLLALAAIVLPAYSQMALSIARAGRARKTAAFWKHAANDFVGAHARLFFRLAFLLHQSLLSMDAAVRAVIRMAITHKKLLEWETAAEAELAARKSPVDVYLDRSPFFAAAIGLLLAALSPRSLMMAFPFLLLWCSAKWITQWLDRPAAVSAPAIDDEQTRLVRHAALRTWRFFREFSGPAENWLIPDTVQEDPPLVVHRISPTNLGFLLNARLAACDLGFLGLPEFVAATANTLDAVRRMPKFRGHFYNWYDTATLEPLPPLFLSTVDNANLACCLWTLKHGCLEATKQPLFGRAAWRGLRNHVELIEEAIATHSPDRSVADCIDNLKQQVDSLDANAAWPDLLSEIDRTVGVLKRTLSQAGIDGEATWWTDELFTRVSVLLDMAAEFMPWLSPRFAKYAASCEAYGRLTAADLTLESVRAFQGAMDEQLQKLAQGKNRIQRSAIQCLRSAISSSAKRCEELSNRLAGLAQTAGQLATDMDFRFLYNREKKLLSIGYDKDTRRVSECHYDFLASEARMAAFIAIAKGDIPQESWLSLDRSQVRYRGSRVLLSWSGTLFEYLMPLLWMKSYPGTILERSALAAVRSQRKFIGSRPMPCGISEAACSEIYPDGQYRYHAFGIPGLALKQEHAPQIVISPYSSFLSLLVEPAGAVGNLQRMAGMGWLASYGFYEAVDYSASRRGRHTKYTLVRCWMAHHQGMSLLAATNFLHNSPMQRRFHAEPMVAATDRLLHEKCPSIPAVQPADKAAPDASALLRLRQRDRFPSDFWNHSSQIRIPA